MVASHYHQTAVTIDASEVRGGDNLVTAGPGPEAAPLLLLLPEVHPNAAALQSQKVRATASQIGLGGVVPKAHRDI